ncbi:MAG: histidine phosphatase family protein [Burkholderiaceae bacterium]|jgi:probable phosphoglycerate mutase
MTTGQPTLESLPPAAAGVCRTVWVRHGETDWNLVKRYQGQLDIPLNAHGRRQADLLARRLADGTFRPAAIYSSDLSRAHETAKAIALALQQPCVCDEALRERHFGCFAGCVAAEMLVSDPIAASGLLTRSTEAELPGGESLGRFHARIVAVLAKLVERHLGQTILVVSHGGILDSVYRHANSLELQPARDWPILNTSVNVVDYEAQATAQNRAAVRCWGDVEHLQRAASRTLDEIDR